MQRIMVFAVVLLLVAVGVPGIAAAQSVVHVAGTIQSVDCQTNTLFLRGAGGVVNTVPGTPYTAAFVNGVPVAFCALQQYIGGYAVATVTAAGNQLVAGRIDVMLAAAPAPAPYYYPYPYGYYPWGYYGPPVGIGIVIGPGHHDFHHRRSAPVGTPRFHGTFHGGSPRRDGR